MKDNKNNILIGVIFFLLGSIFLMNRIGILKPYDIDLLAILWKIWPVIPIILGINILLKRNSLSGFILVVFGFVFLAENLFKTTIFTFFWPLLLIGIGIYIISNRNKKWNSTKREEHSDKFDESIIFWGAEKKFTSKNFKGGSVITIFGGYELDLREVKIAKEGATLEVEAIFGGVEILVPKECAIEVDGDGVFGSWENQVRSRETKTPVLKLTGTALFGGIEIKE